MPHWSSSSREPTGTILRALRADTHSCVNISYFSTTFKRITENSGTYGSALKTAGRWNSLFNHLSFNRFLTYQVAILQWKTTR